MINRIKYDNSYYRIIIVDDNQNLAEAYKLLLHSIKGYNVVKMYSDGESVIEELNITKPDLILMDLELPRMNGIECIERIKRIDESIKIMISSVHDEYHLIFGAFKAGAIGFITKQSDYNQFLSAVDKVLNGEMPISDDISKILIKSFHRNPDSPFTIREYEVLEQLAKGKANQNISDDLGISITTVNTHIQHIYWKLGVDSRMNAVITAREKKYI